MKPVLEKNKIQKLEEMYRVLFPEYKRVKVKSTGIVKLYRNKISMFSVHSFHYLDDLYNLIKKMYKGTGENHNELLKDIKNIGYSRLTLHVIDVVYNKFKSLRKKKLFSVSDHVIFAPIPGSNGTIFLKRISISRLLPPSKLSKEIEVFRESINKMKE